MDNNLEKEFYERNKKTGLFTVICGRKSSGKSWIMTNYIALSYLYNLYDEYYLILPEYSTDANSDTYKFIENHKDTTIYNTYNPKITEHIKKQSAHKKILYCMDDATSYLFHNKHNEELTNLVSTCRHGKGITVIVSCHALKQVLDPLIRGMIDYLFIGAFTNYTIIKKHLYEENCSMMIDEKSFMDEYREKIVNVEHNFLFINGRCQFSFDVNKWELSQFDRNKALSKTGKVKVVNIDKNHLIKDKISQSNVLKELTMKYGIKYKPVKNEGMKIEFKQRRKK